MNLDLNSKTQQDITNLIEAHGGIEAFLVRVSLELRAVSQVVTMTPLEVVKRAAYECDKLSIAKDDAWGYMARTLNALIDYRAICTQIAKETPESAFAEDAVPTPRIISPDDPNLPSNP